MTYKTYTNRRTDEKRKEEKAMKFRPIGLYSESKTVPPCMRATDFSNDAYDGVQLRTARNGMPVIIMHSRKTAPLMWKVAYGYSQVFFRTFAEAVDFCNSRGMEIIKEQMEN